MCHVSLVTLTSHPPHGLKNMTKTFDFPGNYLSFKLTQKSNRPVSGSPSGMRSGCPTLLQDTPGVSDCCGALAPRCPASVDPRVQSRSSARASTGPPFPDLPPQTHAALPWSPSTGQAPRRAALPWTPRTGSAPVSPLGWLLADNDIVYSFIRDPLKALKHLVKALKTRFKPPPHPQPLWPAPVGAGSPLGPVPPRLPTAWSDKLRELTRPLSFQAGAQLVPS